MTTKVTKDNIDITTLTSVGTLANLTVTGNITTSAYFIGNGSQLTGIVAGSNYANSNVASYLPTYSGLVGGTLSTAAQPNITSVGTLASLSVTGITTATGGVKTANILDTSGTVTLQTKYNSQAGDIGVVGNLVVGTGGTGNITTTGITATGNVTLGAVANVHITGGSANYVLTTNGSGNLSWTAQSAGADPTLLLSPFLLMGG